MVQSIPATWMLLMVTGRVDYTLRIRQRAEEQPLAIALIKAKRVTRV